MKTKIVHFGFKEKGIAENIFSPFFFTITFILLLFTGIKNTDAQVPPSCHAAIYDSVLSNDNQQHQFYDLSLETQAGNTVGWYWDLGDSTISYSPNSVYHTYPTPGTYTGCLTITTKDSCQSTACITIFIDSIGTGTSLNVTTSNLANASCPIGNNDGTAKAITNGGIPPYTYSWETSPVQNTQTASNLTTGTYTVTVSDAAGNSKTASAFISQLPCDTNPCFADFAYNFSINDGELLFTDSSTGTNIDWWTWYFGDGSSSQNQNPLHTYTASGIYTVCLYEGNATDSLNTCYTCKQINVIVNDSSSGGLCQGNFSYMSDSLNSTDIQFIDISSSSGNIISCQWDFGDGNTSTSQSPYHQYGAVGSYNVCLTIGTDDSCANTYCSIINAGVQDSLCQVIFTYMQDSTIDSLFGYLLYFYDSTYCSQKKGAVNYHYDFGDGTTLDSPYSNVTHYYNNPGDYTVCLTIDNGSPYCSTVHVKSNITAIHSLEKKNNTLEATIFPNPVDNVASLKIRLSSSTELSIAIFNSIGAFVYNKIEYMNVGEHVVILPVEKLPTGIYLTKIENKEGNLQTVKFIKK